MKIKARTALFSIILLVASMASSPCHAYVKSYLSITSYYSIHDDISLSSGSDKQALQPAITLELAIRLQSIFNLIFTVDNFFKDNDTTNALAKQQMKAYGLGVKVDLPGIFLLKGHRTESTRRGKRHPVNSYFFGTLKQFNTVEPAGDTTTIYSNTYGLGIDVFLFNKVSYLTLMMAILNHGGDNYSQLAAGLGVNF